MVFWRQTKANIFRSVMCWHFDVINLQSGLRHSPLQSSFSKEVLPSIILNSQESCQPVNLFTQMRENKHLLSCCCLCNFVLVGTIPLYIPFMTCFMCRNVRQTLSLLPVDFPWLHTRKLQKRKKCIWINTAKSSRQPQYHSDSVLFLVPGGRYFTQSEPPHGLCRLPFHHLHV